VADEFADLPIPSGIGSEGVPAASPNSTHAQPSGTSPTGAPSSPPAERHIPYDRFREVNEDRQRWRDEAARHRAEVEQWRQRAQALAGLTPTPPAAPVDPHEAEVKAALERLYPGIGKLLARAEQLEQLADVAPRFQQDIEAREQAHYDHIANRSIGTLFQLASEALGGLGEPQKAQLHRAFYGYVATDPEAHARYEAGDPSLVPEFWQAYEAALLAPARRAAAVPLMARAQRVATLPTAGASGGPVGVGPAPPPKDEDAMLDAMWQTVQRARA
jgi:hypothetical protein